MSGSGELNRVTVGDVTIGFREWGDRSGAVIVLLHGAASSHRTWYRLVPALVGGGYRVIAPDLRGHGGSSRPASYPLTGFRDDVIGLLDALDLAQVTVVGHSLGAHIAGLVAQRQPARVTRLVLEDPPVPPRYPKDLNQWSGVARARLYLFGLLRQGFDRRGVASVIDQLRVPDPDWWNGLGAVPAPTLIISGGPTSHISPRWLAAVARALPGSTLDTIPVGHRIHSLAPDRYREVVTGFLR